MCGPGAKEKFETDDKDFYDPDKPNSPRPVTEAFKEVMTSEVNVLLLSGLAGSGKSTAYDKLQTWILTEYARVKKEKEVSIGRHGFSTQRNAQLCHSSSTSCGSRWRLHHGTRDSCKKRRC